MGLTDGKTDARRSIGREAILAYRMTRLNRSSKMRAAAFGFQDFVDLRCSKMAGLPRSRQCLRDCKHAIASDNHGGLWLSMWLTTE